MELEAKNVILKGDTELSQGLYSTDVFVDDTDIGINFVVSGGIRKRISIQCVEGKAILKIVNHLRNETDEVQNTIVLHDSKEDAH